MFKAIFLAPVINIIYPPECMNMSRIYLRPILGWASVIALLAFPLLQVSSAVDMFIKIGDIKGESKSKDHKEEIDVLAWNWGMSNSGGKGSGGGGAGKPNVQDFSFTKYLDISSPELILSTLTGKRHDQAVFSVSNAGKDKSADFLVITLKDVYVTSLQSGGSSGENRFTENVSLDFKSFELAYKTFDDKGKTGKAVKVEYDTVKNEASGGNK